MQLLPKYLDILCTERKIYNKRLHIFDDVGHCGFLFVWGLFVFPYCALCGLFG